MKLGLVGWRGMVGSVLMERMVEEEDFSMFENYFFSTSLAGEFVCPTANYNRKELILDANDIDALKKMDIILTCQGGSYTEKIHPELRKQGWDGYWIDAASTLRLMDSSIIVLDPVNRDDVENAIKLNVKDYVGGNCSVTLVLVALSGLLKEGVVEWISLMTYQAVSGAGAAQLRELLGQTTYLTEIIKDKLINDRISILELEKEISKALLDDKFPIDNLSKPLSFNILPWIDSDLGNGVSREEWKGELEVNKILGNGKNSIRVDGLCVRVPVLRCHSTAMTIKLKKDLPLDLIEKIIKESNPWVEIVPNNKLDSLEKLTPWSVSRTLKVAVGRIRKMSLGGEYLTMMTVGDQLLWGAAEPLRRVLRQIYESKKS